MTIQRMSRLEGITIRIAKNGTAFAHKQILTWRVEDGVADPTSERYLPVEPAAIDDLTALIGQETATILTQSQSLTAENDQLKLQVAELSRARQAEAQSQ